MLTLTVYTDRDNAEDLVLYADGAIVPATALTRVLLELDSGNLDSDAHPELFECPVSLGFTDAAGASHTVDGIRLKLGAAGLATGTHRGRLVVFAPDYPAGLVWDHLGIKVL